MIKYKVSLYPSKYVGYQSKARDKGEIKAYISTIWEMCDSNFWKFVFWLDYIIVLERICLERGLQKIKMTNRCKPYKNFTCKMEYIAYHLYLVNENE